MQRREHRVRLGHRDLLRGGQRLLRLQGEFVKSHSLVLRLNRTIFDNNGFSLSKSKRCAWTRQNPKTNTNNILQPYAAWKGVPFWQLLCAQIAPGNLKTQNGDCSQW
jgi:hypothetical protein